MGLVVAILDSTDTERFHNHRTVLDPELKRLRIGAQLLKQSTILGVLSVFSSLGLGQKFLVRFFICLEHKNFLHFLPGLDKILVN